MDSLNVEQVGHPRGSVAYWALERDRDKNAKILQTRYEALQQVAGPRVGDFVRLLDGRLHRFSHHWGDSLQHSACGSFYLGDGYISFSGSLERAIPLERLRDTGETLPGRVWFFSGGSWQASNGIEFFIPFRVYEVVS